MIIENLKNDESFHEESLKGLLLNRIILCLPEA